MASLAAIGIVSGDIGASCRFYRALGVDVAEPGEGEDHTSRRRFRTGCG
jgi:hypothetical protein